MHDGCLQKARGRFCSSTSSCPSSYIHTRALPLLTAPSSYLVLPVLIHPGVLGVEARRPLHPHQAVGVPAGTRGASGVLRHTIRRSS